MNDLPKIEPCPFCLSRSVVLHRNFDYVSCDSCGARGHMFDGHPYDAISEWNSLSKLAQKADEKAEKEMNKAQFRHHSKISIAQFRHQSKIRQFFNMLKTWIEAL